MSWSWMRRPVCMVNLTNSASMDWFPSWSPDGQRIAFESNRDGPIALYLMDPDGSDVARLTTDNGIVIGRPTWSPDSTRLAFPCRVEGSNDDICAINADGSNLVRLTRAIPPGTSTRRGRQTEARLRLSSGR